MNMPAKKPSKLRTKKSRRPIGLAQKKVKVTKSFFKPLPNKLLDAFEGKSEACTISYS
jgi:hypothetical protein